MTPYERARQFCDEYAKLFKVIPPDLDEGFLEPMLAELLRAVEAEYIGRAAGDDAYILDLEVKLKAALDRIEELESGDWDGCVTPMEEYENWHSGEEE